MLKKSTLREIKSSIARYLAIFAIIALGVGVFTGLKMCEPSMVDTADDYLQDSNLYDYEILTSYGVDDDSVKLALKTDGVKDAETSIQQDIVADIISSKEKEYEVALKAISMPENINKVRLVEGNLPKKDNECVVDNYSAEEYGLDIGKTITLSKSNSEANLDVFKNKKFKIVGLVNSPLYLDYDRGTTSVGTGSLSAFFYINKTAFDVDYGTQMYIKLDGSEYSFSSELDSKLKKYEKSMEDLADKISEQRKDFAMDAAYEMLDEKRAELNAGKAQYNAELNAAQNKLNSGRIEAVNGRNLANSTEIELKSTLKQLESARTQIADGYNQIETARQTLEAAYSAGLMTEEMYNSSMSQINSQKAQLDSQSQQVEDGIKQVNDGLATINSKRKEIDAGEKLIASQTEIASKEFGSAKAELDRAEAALADAEAQIAEMETGNSYVFTRDDNNGYSTFQNNAEIVSNIAKIFPIFFFLVAALVVMTTMTRMIDEQRSQIGVMRALGFTNTAIRNKYLFYSGSASLLGSVVGFLVGCKVFPVVIWKAYTMMYDFNPDVNFMIDWKLCLASTAVALLCAMGATWMSCSKEFKEAPAELIRPKSPPAGKKILLEKFTGLWNKLSFFYKVSLRNVFRYKKRFFMMVLGICGCTALLVAGFGIKSSISGVAEHQFGEVSRYDYMVAFNQDMSKDAQKEFVEEVKESVDEYGDMLFVYQGNAEVKINGKNRELSLMASDDETFTKYRSLTYNGEDVAMPGEGEVLLCRKMHDQEGVNIGDEITVKDGFYKMKATVAGFYENYIEENMVMSLSAYEKGMGKKATIRTALVQSPEKFTTEETRAASTAMAQSDKVATVIVADDIIEMVNTMMQSLNAIVYVVILCAGLLAFIVLYNLTNINILERIREVATIKVLGFYKNETSQYVFRENVILTAISAIIGLPVGRWLLGFVIDNIKIDMIFFLPKLTVLDYVLAFVLTFVFTFIVNLAMKKKLNDISMTESLKTVE